MCHPVFLLLFRHYHHELPKIIGWENIKKWTQFYSSNIIHCNWNMCGSDPWRPWWTTSRAATAKRRTLAASSSPTLSPPSSRASSPSPTERSPSTKSPPNTGTKINWPNEFALEEGLQCPNYWYTSIKNWRYWSRIHLDCKALIFFNQNLTLQAGKPMSYVRNNLNSLDCTLQGINFVLGSGLV